MTKGAGAAMWSSLRFRHPDLSSGNPDLKIHRPISSKTKLLEIFVGDVNVPSQRLRVTIVSVGMIPKSTVEISHRLLMAVEPPPRTGSRAWAGPLRLSRDAEMPFRH